MSWLGAEGLENLEVRALHEGRGQRYGWVYGVLAMAMANFNWFIEEMVILQFANSSFTRGWMGFKGL